MPNPDGVITFKTELDNKELESQVQEAKREVEALSKSFSEATKNAEAAAKNVIPFMPNMKTKVKNKLSADEMNHMNLLHKDVVRMIEAYRQGKGELPADMMARYEHLHKRFIAEAERVGVLQGMYKK